MTRRLAVVLALVATACAHTGAFRAGERAERAGDWDRAILEYARAIQEKPDEPRYRVSLERARLRSALAHTRAARQLVNRGALKEALDEYRLALDLDPTSNALAEEVRTLDERMQAGHPGPTLDEIKKQAREQELPGLSLGPAAREPLGLSFRGASLREAYLALGRAVGVNFVFDPEYQDRRISLDLRDTRFEQALSALGGVGHTFHRVLDDGVVSVLPDSPAKRREYEEQVVRTFFLSNADLKETVDLLRIVLGARRVAPLPGANALTINDTPDKVAAAERILDVIDKRRAEVLVDVEILQVDRGRLQEYGIQITSDVAGLEGVAGAIGPNPNQIFTLEDNPYTKDNLIVSSLPGVLYRLLQSDTSTRLLANPQLRATEGEAAQAHFGDQVPVPVTVFAPVAQGGLSQQPVTSFQYKDVGVNIDITPRVHHDDEVTLLLKLEISAVGPAGFQALPTFSSRTVTTTIRLRDGETSILAGLIQDQERETVSGIPGLASIPFLGRLFSRNKLERTQTDIVMTLTPHIVSRPQLTLDDLRSFELGGESAPLLFEVPPTTPASPAPHDREPTRVEPIRPPLLVPAPSPTPDAP